ncbi:hypothetical protein BB560_002808 [Smittium megazygosporum]|uniref:Cytochrome P450 n=1 Tax=Smittium megazygosporum TaxID=133381 RepID=A0A2T9ZDV4_9FUNG|nr:hypothetical protein BB560_002808 [Smittium megazygosporum]
MIFYGFKDTSWSMLVLFIPLGFLFFKLLKFVSKWLILRQYRKNPFAVIIKNYERSADSNLLEYIEVFKKSEYVSKFIGSKTDLILGKPYLKLFCGLPESTLSQMKVYIKAFHKNWSNSTHFESQKLNRRLMPIISSNFETSIQKVEYIIHENLNKDFLSFLENGDTLIDIAIWQCYGENQEELAIPNDAFYTSIPTYFYLFVTLLGYAFSNFLVDISLSKQIFQKLENEQRMIMERHARMITIEQLDEMVYLDAALTESLRLGNNKMSIKEALCDIFLPNGVFIPKKSLVQFNTISHNRSASTFNGHPHEFIPERHPELGTKLDVTSKTNLVWGLGSSECPYRRYCAIVMKLFAATLIRSYKISQGNTNQDTTHEGYFLDYFVQHAKSSLYLKMRKI